ncbi:DUF1330 domain-containing protein [Pseudomonas sp. RIT-To-2]|uniref:DUF1330 domain-containing protein n=1 Tax=Pseudomonas sp. RIT-To-2 TaxID=3462541 RepID=UPI002413BE5B
MPAYLIGKMHVTDADRYGEYKKLTPEIVEKHGGRFLSRGGDKTMLEGDDETRRVVLVEFPSVREARQFYDSVEYAAARSLRNGAAAHMQLFIIEGHE